MSYVLLRAEASTTSRLTPAIVLTSAAGCLLYLRNRAYTPSAGIPLRVTYFRLMFPSEIPVFIPLPFFPLTSRKKLVFFS